MLRATEKLKRLVDRVYVYPNDELAKDLENISVKKVFDIIEERFYERVRRRLRRGSVVEV
jgi:cell division GTPase FtsZ